jgi:hypothetical protein
VSEGDEIWAALERIAAGAPHPGRVMHNLDRRIRVHRQRRALLAMGGAAVGAAAVGVPAFVLLRQPRVDDNDHLNPGPKLTAAPEPPPGPGNTRAPMLVRPTWLPDGVTEMQREGGIGGAPRQAWEWTDRAYVDLMMTTDLANWEDRVDAMLATSRYLGLSVTTPPPPATEGPGAPTSPGFVEPPPSGASSLLPQEANTTVGPYPAFMEPEPTALAQLTWVIDGSHVVELTVSPAAGGRDVIRRIAASVVADPASGVEVGFSFGWLPASARRAPKVVQVRGDRNRWAQTLKAGERVTASLSTQAGKWFADDGDTKPVTVRGRRGAIREGVLSVQLENRLWLTVSTRSDTDGPPADDDAVSVRVAEGIVLGPDPYLGWLGTR